MGREYYYFAASLPSIQFEGNLPFTVEQFLDDCRRLLAEHDYRQMELYLTGDIAGVKSEHSAIRECLHFLNQFANLIADFRARRAHKESQDYVRDFIQQDPYLAEVIKQAAHEQNLFKAERILDEARWHFLTQVQVRHHYDFEYLVIYGLKIKMLDRYQKLESTAGQEKFSEIENMDLTKVEVKMVE